MAGNDKNDRAVASTAGDAIFQRQSAVFDELTGRLAMDYRDVPIDRGLAEIEAVVAALRHGQ